MFQQEPEPIPEFVLKVYSKCNLGCPDCYMYEMADQSWRNQPTVMSRETMEQIAARAGEHARKHALRQLIVTLHGGEPLLAGRDRIRYLVEAFRWHVPAKTATRFFITTNGLLLNRRMASVLDELGISVSISVNGAQESHDRSRPFKDGRGSYELVQARIAGVLDSPHADIVRRIVCVIDVESDPLETIDALLRLKSTWRSDDVIELLLPHGNWTSPPPRIDPARDPHAGPTPYADWLRPIADYWFTANKAGETLPMIQPFDNAWRELLGRPWGGEHFGLSRPRLAVIETDGSYERVDVLKSTKEGAARTGLSIWEHSLDDLARAMGPRIVGIAHLADVCQRCEIVDVCGGANESHRFRAAGATRHRTAHIDNVPPTAGPAHAKEIDPEFRHPSVYCADFLKFFENMLPQVNEHHGPPATPARVVPELGWSAERHRETVQQARAALREPGELARLMTQVDTDASQELFPGLRASSNREAQHGSWYVVNKAKLDILLDALATNAEIHTAGGALGRAHRSLRHRSSAALLLSALRHGQEQAMHQLAERPKIYQDMLRLLRKWHDEYRRSGEILHHRGVIDTRPSSLTELLDARFIPAIRTALRYHHRVLAGVFAGLPADEARRARTLYRKPSHLAAALARCAAKDLPVLAAQRAFVGRWPVIGVACRDHDLATTLPEFPQAIRPVPYLALNAAEHSILREIDYAKPAASGHGVSRFALYAWLCRHVAGERTVLAAAQRHGWSFPNDTPHW